MRAICYARVSTEDQATNGHSLDYQSTRLKEECEKRGWRMKLVVEDKSAKNLTRPILQEALADLKSKKYDVLMVTKLDRLVRKVIDACLLGEKAQKEKWALVFLDSHIDTTTPYGKAQLGMMAVFAELERDLISQRTKEGLQAAKAKGVVLGRRESVDARTKAGIIYLREEGISFQSITDHLNSNGVPTPSGEGSWSKTVVWNIYNRHRKELAKEKKEA